MNADHSDHDGAHQPCACGAAARFVGRRARRVLTVLGPLHLERAYYHCAACDHGFCPRDRQLGIDGAPMSSGVQRMIGVVGSAVSFAEAADLLQELAGLAVPVRQVERYAERLGAVAAQYECEVAATQETIDHASYLSHLQAFREHSEDPEIPPELRLIYGGDRNQRRSGVDCLGWRDLHTPGW